MPPENIVEEKHWGFKITKDDQNPVLIDFNHSGGARKAATPAFLVAMHLRQHLKAIENEIGEKPKKLAFWIFKVYDEDGMERIHKGIGEACDLLKIEYIFVESNALDSVKF